MDELTMLVAKENETAWEETKGDVLKAKEGTEQAISASSLMMGESLMDASSSYDTVLYREPLGVFAGIVPFNFPAMIPMSWMAPMCIACGNTTVIKAATFTPQTCLRIAELYQEAGLPDGVLNFVTCSRNKSELFLYHPDIKGISFVGSTSVGLHIYSEAASSGRRRLLLHPPISGKGIEGLRRRRRIRQCISKLPAGRVRDHRLSGTRQRIGFHAGGKPWMFSGYAFHGRT